VAPGEVGFNDDAYYLAWRVMVVEGAGAVRFHVTDRATGLTDIVWPDDVLDDWQVPQATSRPDLVLGTAHVIAEQHGNTVEVRADAWVSLNGRPRQRWIDPDIDLSTISRTAPADSYVLDLDPPVGQ
jgi:vitamin K-dependent gamma-carboxylase